MTLSSFSLLAEETSKTTKNHYLYAETSFAGVLGLGYRHNVYDDLLLGVKAFGLYKKEDNAGGGFISGGINGTPENPTFEKTTTYQGIGFDVSKKIFIYKRLFLQLGIGYNYYTTQKVDYTFSHENKEYREKHSFDADSLKNHGIYLHSSLGMTIADKFSLSFGYVKYDMSPIELDGFSVSFDYNF